MTQPTPSTRRAVLANGLGFNVLDFGPPGSGPVPDPADDPRPKMLCLHGGAAHAHWFDFVVGPFTADYRVLSMDLRGHGDSEWAADPGYAYQQYADDVAAVIDAMGIDPVILVGHSMGGMVSLVTTAGHPDKVAALVVVDSLMQMTPERVSTLRGVGQGKGRSFESRAAYIQGFKVRPGGTSARPEVVSHMASHACREFEDGQWRNKFDRNVYARRHPINGFDYWGEVRVPALLVAGALSDRINPQVLARVRESCPQAELAVVEDAHHHVTLDNPSGFATALGGYLGGFLGANRKAGATV